MSEREVRELYQDGTAFRQELIANRWLPASEAESLTDESLQYSPSDLFANADRPLVVGLFGGTGVGKSSLLNRLAGADIARTGVVRPTSMEITVYLHEDVEIKALPAHFPRENISENRHSQQQFARVMWVDMPDFDSDETQNRAQVEQWLPHIDLLIYVVSPERYKDQQGWQLLKQHGYRHAWLFVMNHWDRAQEVQHTDFSELLARAGFESPKIFRMVCSGQPHTEDEFEQLSEFVSRLSERKYISLLDERGWLNRLQALGAEIDSCVTLLQQAGPASVLTEVFTDELQQLEASSQKHLALPFKSYSERFSEKKLSPVKTVFKSLGGGGSGTAGQNSQLTTHVAEGNDASDLWDEWSSTRVSDALLRFRESSDRHGYPSTRLQPLTDTVDASLVSRIKTGLQANLKTALLSPGTRWQRLAVTITRYLQLLLPLLVVIWIVYRALGGFIDGAEDRTAYVGLDFLVNGLILAGIGWLIPWLLSLLLKPSVPVSVNKALQQTVAEEVEATRISSSADFEAIAAEKEQMLARGIPLQQKIRQLCDRTAILKDNELNNLLLAFGKQNN
jgi:energy-coupling factor transporter ATP-binding protein EcfA2